MILPEEVINNYTFDKQNKELKTYLIHHYNNLTLKKYKESEKFYTKEEILESLPQTMLSFYNKSTTKKEHWTEDDDMLEQFKVFLKKYEASETPSLKFKDFMTAFSTFIKKDIPLSFCSKYASLCDKYNIKYEKVVDPRYSNSTGTCYVKLQLI